MVPLWAIVMVLGACACALAQPFVGGPMWLWVAAGASGGLLVYLTVPKPPPGWF